MLRHSAPGRVDADASKLQVYSERVAAQTNTRLFVSDDPPDTVEDEQREVRDMVVQAYYISADSDGRPGMPSLRMKVLIQRRRCARLHRPGNPARRRRSADPVRRGSG